jgi:hypothetical protein
MTLAQLEEHRDEIKTLTRALAEDQSPDLAFDLRRESRWAAERGRAWLKAIEAEIVKRRVALVQKKLQELECSNQQQKKE